LPAIPLSNESDKSSDHDKSLDLTELRTKIADYTPQTDIYDTIKNNVVLPLLDSMIAKPDSAPPLNTLSKGFKKAATEYGLIKDDSPKKEQNGILRQLKKPFKRVQSFIQLHEDMPGDKLQIGFLKTYIKNCDNPKDIAKNIVSPLYELVKPSHKDDPKLEGVDQHIKNPDMFLMKLDSSKLLSDLEQIHSKELNQKELQAAREKRQEAKLKKANSKNVESDESVKSSNKEKSSTDSLSKQGDKGSAKNIQQLAPASANETTPLQDKKLSPQEIADEQLAQEIQEKEVILRQQQETKFTSKYATLSSDNLAKLEASSAPEEPGSLDFKPKKAPPNRKIKTTDRQNSIASEVSFVSSKSSEPKETSFRNRVKPRPRQNSVSSEVSFVSNEERTATKQRH